MHEGFSLPRSHARPRGADTEAASSAMECGGQACAGGNCSSSSSSSLSSSSLSSSSSSSSSSSPAMKVCCKCKEAPAQVAANQMEFVCKSCLNTSLFSKFKTAVNGHGLILPSHRVLLAFSGGPSSRVLLEFLLEIREKAKREAIHYSDDCVKVFGFGVAYVDESCVLPLIQDDPKSVNEEMRKIVMERERNPDEFLIFPLENVYSEGEIDFSRDNVDDSSSKKERLRRLLQSVNDVTGKEDMLQHIRMQALQQVAKAHGYSRVVLGSSTSRIAAKVISSTAKGHGFSLPAEMQFYDARWSAPVVMPLRDCSLKELTLLCHLRNLKSVFVPTLSTLSAPQSSINSLSASFITMLQEENSARERTIVRTATKLQPFSFNHSDTLPPVLNGVNRSNNGEAEILCPLCSLPLNPMDFTKQERTAKLMGRVSDNVLAAKFFKACCSSCQLQNFGEVGATYSLLPQLIRRSEMINPEIKETWMRSQICDWLISD